MAEQADAERLAELNRNKEEYEGRTHAQAERNSREEYDEQQRQSALRKQRDDEVEASAQRIAEGKRQYREEQERKASQERKKQRHAEMNEEREKVRASATSMPTRAEQVERSAHRIQGAKRERDIRRGYDENGNALDYSGLSGEEKDFVKDEVQNSAGEMKARRDKWVAQGRPSAAKDTYFKQTSTGTQIKDLLMGNKPWAEEKKTKEVKPITTFLGGQKHKIGERLDAAGKGFLADLKRPVQGIQAGRQKRAAKQEIIPDPFAGLTQSQQQARVRRHRPREGTGMLFSEGFFNPPARAPPKKGKKGRKPRQPRGELDFDMGSMIL